MRETRDINASLAVLKDCIRGKAEADAHAAAGVRANRRAHVPFRQAALTKVLKHIFDPAATTSGRTVVVACVNPLLGDAAPTRNTLRYAETLRVLVPRMGAPKYNAKAPSTWSNAHVRAWLETESGSPAVDAELLAPTETGLQLLRLPAPEFEARCARTPGVNSQQAAAVRTKFWAMHVDSRATAAPKVGELEPGTGGRAELETMFSQNGSRVADDRPWNQRLRPGMVVAWTPPPMSRYRWSSDFNIVLLLAPTTVATGLIDPLAQPIEPAEGRWLCASITPAELPTAYNVNIWRQIPVDVETMNREVFLEYDPATRFYYVAV
jgi:kinesin family protein 2/24